MKFITIKYFAIVIFASFTLFSCGGEAENKTEEAQTEQTEAAGQSGVKDDMSNPNVVQIAVGSKDHTTLVAAVKAAKLVDVLSNVGPFTVFAPVNAAFDALPKGTVEGLLKPEALKDLTFILEYHVYVGVIGESLLQDGMVLNQVNGKNVTIKVTPQGTYVNDAKIVASVKASNGIIHIIDKVLLPK